jgi:hypothetical protein
MIKLSEILTGLTAKISAMPGGIVIYAVHNDDVVGKLQVGWGTEQGTAVVLAADANIMRQGVGTFLYQQLKEFLEDTGIEWLIGAVEGSGVVQIREKVFGAGNTHYFSRGGEVSAQEAIHIMDVEFGRVIAKTKIR